MGFENGECELGWTGPESGSIVGYTLALAVLCFFG
jgi:hypothetical protein